jgi:hypothetical protein
MAKVKQPVTIRKIQQAGADAVQPGIGASRKEIGAYVEGGQLGLPITDSCHT